MIEEVLENGGIGIFAVENILGRQVPVVCICKVSRVQYKVVIVNGTSERTDGRVVQGRLYIGNVAFAGRRIAVFTVYTELMIKIISMDSWDYNFGDISHQ